MACLPIARSGFSLVHGMRPGTSWGTLASSRLGRGVILSPPCRCLRDDKPSSDREEEPPESLFTKELKKRGMGPASLSGDSSGSRESYFGRVREVDLEEELHGGGGRGPVKRNGVASADYEKELANQRERSMSLNSEGLEGLVPRAKLLLTTGGTFFLGFWPLMLGTIGIFSALYFYFGSSFVHDASKIHLSPPPYVDPYALLEDENITEAAPRLDLTPPKLH